MAIIWFLISYFSLFFIEVSATDSYAHVQGFTNRTIMIERDRIEASCNFVFLFNLLFLVTDLCLERLLGIGKRKTNWQLPTKSINLDKISFAYLSFLMVGGTLYAIATKNFDYKDYVDFQGSSWSMVFLWASTPYITIATLQKKYLRAMAACIPFLYFAFLMKVRSFALLSIIPLAIIYALQASTIKHANMAKRVQVILFGGSLVLVLVFSSAIILSTKGGEQNQRFSLPDSGMPFGVAVMMELSDKYHTRTGFDALTLYARNLTLPFVKLGDKLFNDKIEDIVDPPYVMGQLYDDVPKHYPLRLHYPALWYADAYFAFGENGIYLAIFWALVLTGWEVLMSRSGLLFGLLLPFYSWHGYMLIRGAIAGASVPISYSLYVTLITAVIFLGTKVLANNSYWSGMKRRTNSIAAEAAPAITEMKS